MMMEDDMEGGTLGPYPDRPRTFPSMRKAYTNPILRLLMGVNSRVLFIILLLGIGALFYVGARTSPIIVFVFAVCIISFGLSVYLTKWVLSKDEGPPGMAERSDAIRDGAEGFFRTQYGTISKMAFLLALLILCICLFCNTTQQEASSLGRTASAFITVAAYLLGALCSGIAGYAGMWVSVRANVKSIYCSMTICQRGTAGTCSCFQLNLEGEGAAVKLLQFQSQSADKNLLPSNDKKILVSYDNPS